MMKKAMACMLIMALLTSCSTKGEGREKSKKAEIPKTEAATEFSETGTADNLKTVEQSATLTADSLEEPKTQIGEKIEPLLSEKIDVSKQGMLMSLDKKLSSEMARGMTAAVIISAMRGKGRIKKLSFTKTTASRCVKQP